MVVGIRLLGPTELITEGRPVDAGPAKRRGMLAALALQANRPVSLARLTEQVWAGQPPRSAVANLRNHAAALRKVLRDRIVARNSGYQLRLAEDELDVTTFLRAAAKARQALAAGDPMTAEPGLAAALRLWRGAAGDGLPRGTALEAQLESLDEHRLLTFEDLVDARLALGRHMDVLGELREHVARHPLRERAWGQTMLALYRGGDTAGALATYRHARAVLDDQLGIEPGPDLTALHRAMLDRAPQLLPAGLHGAFAVQPEITIGGSAPQRAQLVVPPRELPPEPAVVVGRTDELAKVLTALLPGKGAGTRCAFICGAAGVGKSTLAIRAGHRLAAAFPDGQIYMDLSADAPATPGQLVGRALRALGPTGDVPESTDERIGRYRSLTAVQRVLIIVDGVSRAAQVRAVAPAGAGSALIAVSRRQLGTLEAVTHVHLSPMTAADARAFLTAYVGEERLGDAAATADLIELCDRLPLALRIAAARLASRPGLTVKALNEQLVDYRLDGLVYDDLSMRESLSASYACVQGRNPIAAHAFRLLGRPLGGAGAAQDLAELLGVPPRDAQHGLDELIEANLAVSDRPGYYRLPGLVARFAMELAGAATVSGGGPARNIAA
jgi:DNA-binding SARP family transcriptional activator